MAHISSWSGARPGTENWHLLIRKYHDKVGKIQEELGAFLETYHF